MIDRRLQNRIMVAEGLNAEAFSPYYNRNHRGRYGGRVRKNLKDGCMWHDSCSTCEFPDCICHEFDYYTIRAEAERQGITFDEQKHYLLKLKLANLTKGVLI